MQCGVEYRLLFELNNFFVLHTFFFPPAKCVCLSGNAGPNRNGAMNRRMDRGIQSEFPPPAFTRPGYVLEVKNVPYKAGTEDILEFFRDFNIPEVISVRILSWPP
jgi:hypothetical protein